MNAYDFGGRVALVTGGASGIGAAAVKVLRDGGARVAVLDLAPEGLDGDVLAIQGDVSRSDDADRAVAQVEAELGGLDVLVCSAGVGGDSLHTVDVDDAEWRRVFAINCDGTFFCNRAALRAMIGRGYGRIVNVASIAGKEIDTPILSQLTDEHIGYMVDRIPLKRVGKPEEVARLIASLASEDLSFATGACFDVSGGRAVY